MKTLLLIISFSICTTLAIAQAPKTADQKADETVNKLKTELYLTDEQTPKVKDITVDRINKITAAVKKNGPDKQRLQYDTKKIFEAWETNLKGILSETQNTKYLQSKNGSAK